MSVSMRTKGAGVFPLLLAAASLALLPRPGDAQWVEAPGRGWLAATIYHQDTRDRYDSQGEERPFFASGHAVATSLYLTGAIGLLPGVDAWIQLPVHRLRFDDAAGERNSTGLGDGKAWVRIAPLSFLGSGLPLAVRAGVKVPLGDFPVDAEVIPLGEGQRDWEVILELGHSFYPAPLYAMVWLGYRWREKDVDNDRDWGNERFIFSQVGGSLGPVGYKVILETWDSRTPIIEGIPVVTASRDFLQIIPSVTISVGSGEAEVGIRAPLRGKNLPAGNALVLGYFVAFGG